MEQENNLEAKPIYGEIGGELATRLESYHGFTHRSLKIIRDELSLEMGLDIARVVGGPDSYFHYGISGMDIDFRVQDIHNEKFLIFTFLGKARISEFLDHKEDVEILDEIYRAVVVSAVNLKH